MKLTGTAAVLSTALIMACTSAPVTTVVVPASAPSINPTQSTPSVPVVTAPVRPIPRSGTWAFSYAPGTYTYTITTDATIAPVGDTTQQRQVPELSQKATITISATGDVAVTDPVAVTSGVCDPNATLTTRAQGFISKLSNHLTAGDSWRDSTTTTGCRGMIPAESTIISNYVAIGDTTFANTLALQIHRTDSLTAIGEGAEGQHRILVTAKGTGLTDLFFNVATGRFIGSRGQQTSLVNVTTSGRLTQFIQRVTELVAIVGLQ